MSYIAENNAHSTDTFSAVVAAWKADQKDPGSNLLWILLFLQKTVKSLKFCLYK